MSVNVMSASKTASLVHKQLCTAACIFITIAHYASIYGLVNVKSAGCVHPQCVRLLHLRSVIHKPFARRKHAAEISESSKHFV